jgi:predicted N-acetyltransferase YhbS
MMLARRQLTVVFCDLRWRNHALRKVIGEEGSSMTVTLRQATPTDAPAIGRVMHDAFKTIAERHGFPPDFPSPEVAGGLAAMLLGHGRFYGVVAERANKLVGSNFLDLRGTIGGIGPIVVDPSEQDRGIGKRLMQDVLERAERERLPGVRLVQTAYHNRSLSLYTKLGFRTREPLSVMQGLPLGIKLAGYDVRSAREDDRGVCNRLCRTVHGHDRARELDDAIREGTANVVEHQGRITGYATQIAFFAHAVGETNRDLMALIGGAPAVAGPGFFVPTRNHELFAWCLEHGLGLVQQMMLMTFGLYNEPTGAYLPSVLY